MRVAISVLLIAGLSACTFGPGHLGKGHLAYNVAVKSATDDELLLNIVRLRYLDTMEFVSITSISSQLELAGTTALRGGTDTLFGNAGVMGTGAMNYSTRPTFTFMPQRGQAFAKRLIEPVGINILAYLIAADWDAKMLFRMLVRSLNDLDNELGVPGGGFAEATDRMATLQARNDFFIGFTQEIQPVSAPIDAKHITGTDLVEAAKSGYRFQQDAAAATFVLSEPRSQAVMALPGADDDSRRLRQLLGVKEGLPYYDLDSGVHIGQGTGLRSSVIVRTGSLLRALIYLAQGVEVPAEHVEMGLTTAEFPPGSEGTAIDELFQLKTAEKKPKSLLRVEHRDHWFYIDDDDLASRFTFFHLSELFRLGLAESGGQSMPVLTLPVGR